MKKIITAIVAAALLATAILPVAASAQTSDQEDQSRSLNWDNMNYDDWRYGYRGRSNITLDEIQDKLDDIRQQLNEVITLLQRYENQQPDQTCATQGQRCGYFANAPRCCSGYQCVTTYSQGYGTCQRMSSYCPAPRQYTSGQACAQVVVWAKNPNTGQCCRYSSPCQAPLNWRIYYSYNSCLSGMR